MSIGGQQCSVRDVPELALFFLKLGPKESRVVPVPVVDLGISRLLPSSTNSSNVSDVGMMEAGVHGAWRGQGLLVLCCAWGVGHVGLGAGDHFVQLITIVPRTLVRRNGT